MNELIILIVPALYMKLCPWVDRNYIKEASLLERKVFRYVNDITNLRYIFINTFGDIMDLDDLTMYVPCKSLPSLELHPKIITILKYPARSFVFFCRSLIILLEKISSV